MTLQSIQKIIPTDYCQLGDLIYLTGKFGSGKTTLIRGFLREGYKGFVKSPSI